MDSAPCYFQETKEKKVPTVSSYETIKHNLCIFSAASF